MYVICDKHYTNAFLTLDQERGIVKAALMKPDLKHKRKRKPPVVAMKNIKIDLGKLKVK